MMQAACALEAATEILALAACTARLLRRYLQLGGMEVSALFRLERLHRAQAHAVVPDAIRAACLQLSAPASAALIQQGGLQIHEVALLRIPVLLQTAVVHFLNVDNGRLTASHGYDYMPRSSTQLFQTQSPPNVLTELPICLLAHLKPHLSQSLLTHLQIAHSIPHDISEQLLKASTAEDPGITSMHTPLLSLDLQIGRVPTHILCAFVSSLTSLTCLKLQNLVNIVAVPGDPNPDFQPSLDKYPPQIPGHEEPFPIHARKPFTRVLGDPMHMTPIVAAAQSPSGRTRGAPRQRVGSSSAVAPPDSPSTAAPAGRVGPSGVEGRDDRAARSLAIALNQLQELQSLTLAPAPANVHLWQRMEVFPALTALELVFYGPYAHSGTASNAKDSPAHAVEALRYIRKLPELQDLKLSCRRWSTQSEQELPSMLLELTSTSLQSLFMQMALSSIHAAPLMHAIAAKTTIIHLSLILREDFQVAGPAAASSGLDTFSRGWPVLTSLQSLRKFVYPRMSFDARAMTVTAWMHLHQLESFTIDWPRGNRAVVELFSHVASYLPALTALRVIGLDEHSPSLGHDEGLLLFHTLRSSAGLPMTLKSLSMHGVTFPQLGEGSSLGVMISHMHAMRTLLITAPPQTEHTFPSGDLDSELQTGPIRAWQLSLHLVPLTNLQSLRLEIPAGAAIPIARVPPLVAQLCNFLADLSLLTDLRELALVGCSILPNACAETLAASITNLVRLSYLDLSDNPLTGDSFAPMEGSGVLLDGALMQLTQLTALKLENCLIEDAALHRLSVCLSRLLNLQLLHLRGNNVTEESAQVLLDAVTGLPLSKGVKIMYNDA